ncbi:transposase family protein [Thorsellia anophelis]|uniref:transposase family protein n=1 Tax=Thorsellia anophelis TaxID=336804 RepID=UPI000B855170
MLIVLICDYSTWASITKFGNLSLKWFHQMPYKQGIPTRHNVARIIRMIKPKSLNMLLITWAQAYANQSTKVP